MCSKNKRPYKTICISGGMDCPHSGHIAMINEAAQYGKVIIILNSDDWLIRKKGYYLLDWNERKSLLINMKNVFDVVPVDDSDGSVCEALTKIKPTFFANGGDRTNKNTPELQLCKKLGIKPLFGIGGTNKVTGSSILFEQAMIMFIKNAGKRK